MARAGARGAGSASGSGMPPDGEVFGRARDAVVAAAAAALVLVRRRRTPSVVSERRNITNSTRAERQRDEVQRAEDDASAPRRAT